MEKIFTCIKNIGVWNSFEKMKPQLCFFLKNLSSLFLVLLDLYQITMAYAYWKSNKRNDRAVFDLYFRRNPFKGEFTLFAGLDECVKFIKNFHYTQSGNKIYVKFYDHFNY